MLNSEDKFDPNMIEVLLSVLSHPDEPDVDDLMKQSEFSGLPSVSDVQSKYTAYLTLKLLDEMPGGFFICRMDQRETILYANKALIQLFQCNNRKEFQELTGNSFRGMVHPDDLEMVERSIHRQIEEHKIKLDTAGYRIVRQDGKVCRVDDCSRFFRSRKGENVIYVFITEIAESILPVPERQENLQAEEKQEERQLRLIHQEHLRRLEMIEGLSIDYQSIFYADLDEDRIHAYRLSERFEQVFGEGRQVRRYRGFDKDYADTWVYPEDRKFYVQHTRPEYIRRKLSKDKVFYINYRIYKGGKTAYIQLRVVNVGSGGSQVVLGYRNIDDEIILQMRQKRKLAEALNQAKFANKVKNSFLSNMSHDIRTPMNAIVGFANLAKNHIDDKEKVAEYLRRITNSSSELLTMLNNVFEISRIESSQIHIVESESSLLDILDNVKTAMQPRAESVNIDFSMNVAGLVHEKVLVDQQKLSQVLLCLTENAIKYTRTGDWIRVSLSEQEQKHGSRSVFRFEVEDNGIGIHKEFIAHIFEPFEREKNTTLSGIHGSGLGLAIAKKIVDKMGGTIEVSSIPGKGSRFTVIIALSFPEQPDDLRQDEYENDPVHRPAKHKILLVDDNEINLEIGMEVLKDAGYPVDTAMDGSIAVDKVRNAGPGDYALILMDLQMPVMNGHDAAREIRRIKDPGKANIPIIALSANTFEEDKRMSIESGMNAHLPKPIDAPQLYEVIRKILSTV